MTIGDFERNDWLDENGSMSLLHQINPLRLSYIFTLLSKHLMPQQFHDSYCKDLPLFKQELQKVKLLDLGCGAGILSHPIARMGAQVVGIDKSLTAITLAKKYSSQHNLNCQFYCHDIDHYRSYLRAKKEDYLFDVITALEVIEHLDNASLFLNSAWSLLRKGGLFFISSINRTIQSFFKAIVIAEYILNLIPKNIHKWQFFISPQEIMTCFSDARLIDLTGMDMKMTLQGNSFSLSSNINTNYIMCLQKI